MYLLNDKKSAVKSVQRYLSKIYSSKISVAENGHFDDNTLLALHTFQKENGREIKDYVDYNDFTLIYDEYLKKLEIEYMHNIYGSELYPIVMGDTGDEVLHINRMLLEILEYYGYYIGLDARPYYSQKTAEAIDIITEIFEYENEKIIDELLHSRIEKEWKSIRESEYLSE